MEDWINYATLPKDDPLGILARYLVRSFYNQNMLAPLINEGVVKSVFSDDKLLKAARKGAVNFYKNQDPNENISLLPYWKSVKYIEESFSDLELYGPIIQKAFDNLPGGKKSRKINTDDETVKWMLEGMHNPGKFKQLRSAAHA